MKELIVRKWGEKDKKRYDSACKRIISFLKVSGFEEWESYVIVKLLYDAIPAQVRLFADDGMEEEQD